MPRTPQEFKRQELKKMLTRVLGDSITRLLPISINVRESLQDDFTITDFSFEKNDLSKTVVPITESKGRGFVDGLFNGLRSHFVDSYSSLSRIKLVDISVNPVMSSHRRKMATDAQAEVAFTVEVAKMGKSQFEHTSRSMIYSSYVSALNVFEFYINCERSFDKIILGLEDARSRNRFDIVEQCKYDLSRLTEINNYEKKIKN